ncbi:MAG: amidohydrolase family protein [Acidimicrobiales bacterium]
MSANTDAHGRETVDLLVLGGDIVTMSAERRVIRDGAVAVRENRIAWVGPAAEARGRFQAVRTIEAAERIVLPGLVDTHFHTGQQLLRGKISELARRRQLKLPIWRNYLIPFESVLTEEDMHLSAQIAYANLLRVGTTCFADAGGPHPHEMARAAMELGIRGLVAQSTMDMGDGLPPSMRFSTQKAIEHNVSLIKTWGVSAVEQRVGAWLSLRQLLVCSRELWEAFRDLSDESGSRVHIHLAEGTYEVDYAAEHWGKRPAEYLEMLGFLGPRVHAAHSILLSADEIGLYAERHVSAAHCPLGNFLIGPPKVPEMRRRAIHVGLGTDGASTGSLDLFEAMRVSFVAIQSLYATPWHDRSALSLEDLLEMATLEGAKALGVGDHVGSLEVGKLADLVIANPGNWDLQPVYDPMFTASRGLTGRDVETVVVDGEVVVEGGVVSTVDEAELRGRLAERWPEIMSRFESTTN